MGLLYEKHKCVCMQFVSIADLLQLYLQHSFLLTIIVIVYTYKTQVPHRWDLNPQFPAPEADALSISPLGPFTGSRMYQTIMYYLL